MELQTEFFPYPIACRKVFSWHSPFRCRLRQFKRRQRITLRCTLPV